MPVHNSLKLLYNEKQDLFLLFVFPSFISFCYTSAAEIFYKMIDFFDKKIYNIPKVFSVGGFTSAVGFSDRTDLILVPIN